MFTSIQSRIDNINQFYVKNHEKKLVTQTFSIIDNSNVTLHNETNNETHDAEDYTLEKLIVLSNNTYTHTDKWEKILRLVNPKKLYVGIPVDVVAHELSQLFPKSQIYKMPLTGSYTIDYVLTRIRLVYGVDKKVLYEPRFG